MSSLAFQHLPPELLQQCASHLDRPALSALSLTARACHSIAVVYLFRRITINIDGYLGLVREVQSWNTILGRASAHKYVDQLKLEDIDLCSKTRTNERWQRNARNCFVRFGLDRDAGRLSLWSEENYLEPERQVPHDDMIEDGHWQPLIEFITRLPVLQRFIYKNSDSIPVCLVETLLNYHPRCHLHMAKLEACSLNTLYDQGPGLALAISPILYSMPLKVMAEKHEYESEEPIFIQKMLDRAPNLQELSIWWASGTLLHSSPPRTTSSQHQKSSLHREKTAVKMKSCTLKSLKIHMNTSLSQSQVEYLSCYLNFAQLRTLKLSRNIRADAFSWMTANCPLPSLNTLVLETWSALGIDDAESTSMYHETLATFLLSLVPLTHLRIRGSLHRRSVAAVLDYHSPTLRQLWLENDLSLTAEQFAITIEQLNEYQDSENPPFPYLIDLKLPVRRSQDDKKESAVYELIGTFPQVRHLTLTLEVMNPSMSEIEGTPLQSPSPLDPTFDDFDLQPFSKDSAFISRKLLNGHIRNSMLNSAVDGILARSIFDTVENGKRSLSNGTSVASLETLTIVPVGGVRFGFIPWIQNFDDVIRNLSRSWSVNRKRDETEVKEIGKGAREELNQSFSQKKLQGNLKLIFDRIWPRDKNQNQGKGEVGKNGVEELNEIDDDDDDDDDEWRDRWKSLPLIFASNE